MSELNEPQVEVVSLVGLRPVGRRPSIGNYLAALWKRRHFILADSRARVASGSQQMVLGQAWLVLKPVLDAAVYLVIFGFLLRTDRGIENFLGYLVIGVFMFQFTSRCLLQGGTSITGGKSLIHAFAFPRAALPIAAVVREMLSMVPVLSAMALLLILMPPGADLSWRWFLFPLVFVLQLIFNMGIAFFAARLVAHVRDMTHILSLLSRFWLYGSAVFFTIDRFDNLPELVAIMRINPVFIVLDMTRDLLLYATTPSASSWLLLAAWAVVSVVTGFIFFWRGEEKYGRS